MSLADETLLAFQRRDREPLRGDWAAGNRRSSAGLSVVSGADVAVTFGDATRHVAVFGQTGCGKSVGVVRPALRRLIESGCSGIVLDAKSEYLDFRSEYPDRVVTIGAGAGCEPINLLCGMPTSVFREFLAQIRTRSRDGYWGATAVDDAVLVLLYYRACGRNPTLATVVNALLNARAFVQEFDAWAESARMLPAELDSAIRMQQSNAFGLLSLGGSRVVEYDAKRSESVQRAQEQYTWHIQHLLPGLRAAVADSRIQRGLCADATLDLADRIYRRRQVLLVDLPETHFGAAASVLGRLLRTRFIATVLSYPHHARDGYGRDRFTFCVADEYQHFLHLDSEGIAGGIYDDTVAHDRLRAKGHIQIVSTQSVAALRARRPVSEAREAVDCLLANVATVVAFSSNCPETARHLGGRVPQRTRARVEDVVAGELRRGEAVVVASELTRHSGPLVGTVRTGSTPGAPWMGRYIQHQVPDVAHERYAMPPQNAVPNPLHVSADRCIALAEERFSAVRDELLELVAEGFDFYPDAAAARTALALGRFEAEFSLCLDQASPLRSMLRVRGLELVGPGSELDFPLESLYRIAADFSESALAEVDEWLSLDERTEHEPLTLERTSFSGSRVTLLWDGVGRLRLSVDGWRILAWAATRYRQLVGEAVTALAKREGGVFL